MDETEINVINPSQFCLFNPQYFFKYKVENAAEFGNSWIYDDGSECVAPAISESVNYDPCEEIERDSFQKARQKCQILLDTLGKCCIYCTDRFGSRIYYEMVHCSLLSGEIV